MSQPSFRWSTLVGQLPTDASGRRFFTAHLFDVLNGAIELRVESLLEQLFATGGVTTLQSLDLVGSSVEILGPVHGIAGPEYPLVRTPVLLDPLGQGVSLDLATEGAQFGDGTHLICVSALAEEENFTFTTPVIASRDESGAIIAETQEEDVTYALRRYLGMLVLREGTTALELDAPLATVEKSGSSWSSLTRLDPPRLRAGLPSGGTTGQLLAKASGDDFDTEWIDP